MLITDFFTSHKNLLNTIEHPPNDEIPQTAVNAFISVYDNFFSLLKSGVSPNSNLSQEELIKKSGLMKVISFEPIYSEMIKSKIILQQDKNCLENEELFLKLYQYAGSMEDAVINLQNLNLI